MPVAQSGSRNQALLSTGSCSQNACTANMLMRYRTSVEFSKIPAYFRKHDVKGKTGFLDISFYDVEKGQMEMADLRYLQSHAFDPKTCIHLI